MSNESPSLFRQILNAFRPYRKHILIGLAIYLVLLIPCNLATFGFVRWTQHITGAQHERTIFEAISGKR